MGAIEDIYEELTADLSFEEFRTAVDEKVAQMGGLADEETAAMLIAHELGERTVSSIADIEPGMDEANFLAKILRVGEVRTFERDDDDDEGTVVNVDAADESGTIRLVFWDEYATAVEEEGLEPGTVLRVRGRPREGFDGVEVNVSHVEVDEDADIEVDVQDAYRIEDLDIGQSNVTLRGRVLDVDAVRTFSRDDGSEGQVGNLSLGDETGRIRVTVWDERTADLDEIDRGDTIEILDGYVRERDERIELHVGNRGALREIDESIDYVPQTHPIGELQLGQTVDISGVIRSVDPVRTFERDDGSEGQVRNVRVQDETGDIRVALWGEKADVDLDPGDTALFADVEIKEGWQDDLEASAGWRSTVTTIEQGMPLPDDPGGESDTGLAAFAGESGPDDASTASEETDDADSSMAIEFTGTVVQTGNPVVLDDGSETIMVRTDAELTLGQEVTARGRKDGDRLIADDVF